MRCRVALVAMIGLAGGVHTDTAMAQSCEAHFSFDGSLADGSGNGFDGSMIGLDGTAAAPRFVEGRSGQALALDGTAAMRAPIDLNYESCPQVSFTAWVRFDGPVQPGNRVILSTGSGTGPGLRTAGKSLVLNGTANGLRGRDVVRPNSGWMFVAGVYDYANGRYTLHWRNRSVDGTLSKHRRLPEDAIWIGATNDRLVNAASSIVIDDLRVYGTALEQEDLRALARSRPAASTAMPRPRAGTALPGDQYDPERLPGDQYDPERLPGNQYDPERLPGDQYDPERLPGDQYDPERLPGDQYDPAQPSTPLLQRPPPSAGIQQRLEQRATENRPLEFGSGTRAASGSREVVNNDSRERLQARAESSRPLELGYDSEEEGVAAAEAAAERRAQEQAEAEAAARLNAEAAANPSEDDSAPSGTPRPVGDARYTVVAGWQGETQRILDLETGFLREIEWGQVNSRPCYINIGSGDPNRTGYLNLNLGCGGGNIFTSAARSVRLETSVIASIEVCTARPSLLRAIRVRGDRVNEDGTLQYVPASDQESFGNCEPWSQRILCPFDYVATGVVVHSSDDRGDREAIVGLQLVCRTVGFQ